VDGLKKLARRRTLLLTRAGLKIRAAANEIVQMVSERRKTYWTKDKEQ
jgi:hypothetical protein